MDLPDTVVVEPQADDLETVARSKIAQAMNHLPQKDAMVMVEDAGLFVDALDGFPGVYSSHAFSTIGNHGILRLLSHLVDDDPVRIKNLRSASFQAVAALWDGEKVLIGKGVCKGAIATDIQGEAGFGLDPIFIPSDLDESGEPLSPVRVGNRQHPRSDLRCGGALHQAPVQSSSPCSGGFVEPTSASRWK